MPVISEVVLTFEIKASKVFHVVSKNASPLTQKATKLPCALTMFDCESLNQSSMCKTETETFFRLLS